MSIKNRNVRMWVTILLSLIWLSICVLLISVMPNWIVLLHTSVICMLFIWYTDILHLKK
jgi:hypothetical protein